MAHKHAASGCFSAAALVSVATEFSLDRSGTAELINMKRRFNDVDRLGCCRARAMPINSFHNLVCEITRSIHCSINTGLYEIFPVYENARPAAGDATTL